ncbi:LysE family translocator [Brenneria alni]|uniref:LysE family translocator n=1 Tax=Brenneria alni TaxID=71656 RepID=UPI0014735666|nr:LysE family translocator [Brenneria alni]
MTIEYWFAFLSAVLLINITPGPDLLFILSKSSRSGRLSAFWGAVGLWTAALTHVSAVAIGLSAIIFASQTMFTLIKYTGAAYLIWLGIKLFFSSQALLIPAQIKEGRLKSFASGFLVNISNPKAALFFMAFLPMFVQSDDAHPQIQMFILGILVVLVKVLIELLLIFCSSYISGFFARHQNSGKIVSRVSSLFFIGFGLQLIILRRP